MLDIKGAYLKKSIDLTLWLKIENIILKKYNFYNLHNCFVSLLRRTKLSNFGDMYRGKFLRLRQYVKLKVAKKQIR